MGRRPWYDEELSISVAAEHIGSIQEDAMTTAPPKNVGGRGALTPLYLEQAQSFQTRGGSPRVYVLDDWAPVCQASEQA